MRCSACCARFSVDLARAESAAEGGTVPEGLIVDVTTQLCRMRGTDHAPPRCAALIGRVGVNTRCAIHEWRPSPCREFGLCAPMGIADDACTRVRRRHGLTPL